MRDYPQTLNGLRGRRGVDPRLDRLFTTLEAQFGASIDRAEEEAASDLAVSLRQDLSLREALLSGPVSVLSTSGRQAIREVAKDHVRVERPERLIPFSAAEFETGGAGRPEPSELTLTQALRVEARSGRIVQVATSSREVTGRVVACSNEHLTVQGQGAADVLLPLAQILAIRLFLED